MVEIRSGIVFAQKAIAGGRNWSGVAIIFFFVGGVKRVEIFFVKIDVGYRWGSVDIEPFVAGIAGGQDTIKDVPTGFYQVNNFFRFANAQAVEQVIFWGVFFNNFGALIVKTIVRVKRPAAVAKTVKTDFN